MTDEYCYLLMAVFGGLKNMRNDRRILNNLMMIGVKVFEFELNESTAAEPKIEYSIPDLLSHKEESCFQKIHRLVF